MEQSLIKLPDVGKPGLISGGRCVRDGYQRGWGLQFTDLAQQVAADPLYQAALEASGGWSVMTTEKRMNLF